MYDERPPLPSLTGLIRTVWVQRTGSRPALQRHLPTGGMELRWPIGSTPSVLGPLTRAREEVLPRGSTVVGARFWPGAATPLLGVPADDLVDQVVPLEAVSIGFANLGSRLSETPGPDLALRLLQLHVVESLLRLSLPDPVVTAAARRLMPWQPSNLGQLTEDLSMSRSQLRRRFKASIGLGPKTLQRTLRLQGYLALAQAAVDPSCRVADLAADVGYADQAHLGRECLRLTGQTPRELLGDAFDRCGCGHDHAASYLPFLAFRPRIVETG